MSLAKKCDSCGKLYEPINDESTVDGVILIHWTNGSGPKWMGLKYMDLCPDCADKICHDANYTTMTGE